MKLAILVGVSLGLSVGLCIASEFPERECCDPVYPLPAVSASVTPDPPSSVSVSISTAVTQGTRTGPVMKSAVETLNCLLARQLCFEDLSCSPILETIPRVCGAEIVSCSTVTVTKCQAALRTLQLFPFFKPTCLCREPQVDQDCNSFRNFLFDHPCMFVIKKEKDPYPVEALPTCNHAVSVCQKERSCGQLYKDFKTHCKVRDGKCLMEDRDLCHESWTNIRFSPMFGCICPNNHMKKRCDTVFTLVNHNPCIGSGHKSEENTSMSFQSTCNQALELCNNNENCKVSLTPVLQYCNATRCRRNNCMEALQNLYRTIDLNWSLEIAFCLCKKTKNNQDECLIAQEILHPVCAQQVDGPVVPTCHSLAEYCREDASCRSRLESYEQSCAVDSVTKQCAGAPGECRKAMLGILGTALRSNCACKGTEISQLYDCMGWQRVLWFNPCVVESQRDFHAKKLKETQRTPTTEVISTTPVIVVSTPRITTTVKVKVLKPELIPAIETTTTSISTTTHTTTTIPTTTQSTTTETTTRLTTTETAVVSKFCVVQRQYHPDQKILEGEGKRLYRDEDPDCSEVCQCNEGEVLVCNTVCVERAACKTDFAFYNHAAPAYQAYRGRCLCYSGRFICMRPAPDAYKLLQGVFLFLGYSEVDEALLKKNQIKLEVQDAVTTLQQIIQTEIRPKTLCVLSLFSISTENLILVAKLADVNSSLTRNLEQQSNLNILLREKEECVPPLQDISEKINSRNPLLHTNLLLSIFKMAEVEVVFPATSSSTSISIRHLMLLNISIVHILFHFESYYFMHSLERL